MGQEPGWPSNFPVDPDGRVQAGIVVRSLSGEIEGRTSGGRTRCYTKTCPGWFIWVVWETGQEMKPCSEGWAYDPVTNEVRVTGGGEISARFVSPPPLGEPPLPRDQWPTRAELAEKHPCWRDGHATSSNRKHVPEAKTDDLDPAGICEHGEIRAACIDCLHKPRPPKRQPAPTPRPTTAPQSAQDPIRPLSGNKDVSIPVFDIEPYVEPGTSWLIAQGYPHDLRSGGWVYLRCNDRHAARVRARGIAWREERPWRTGDTDDPEGAGPGLVFNVDPSSWERVDISFHRDPGDMRSGFRYLITNAAGDDIVPLMARDPLPEGHWNTPEEAT